MSTFVNHYLTLPEYFYQQVKPTPLSAANLVHINTPLMEALGISLSKEQLLQMTSGQQFPPGFVPIAQKYTGHQFGYYNPELGDGRGVLLGQVTDTHHQAWDFHLKGSGQTPFSRRGDGRAVLRSAVREYLIGEALHALGVPTTRCLSLCHSPEQVQREQLEDRASYLRIAKTHIRFGHFEWLAQRGDVEGLKQLSDYVIKSVYPELQAFDEAERYAALLNSIVKNTALMIAKWQKVGFCHGVMNTDNMSVAGETFDFGPYAFLDDCKIHFICNHSDTEGRYAYSQQPTIGLWNCQVLIQAFSFLVSEAQSEIALNLYIETYNQHYLEQMGAKLGLAITSAEDKTLIADTLILLDQSDLDFHYFFQLLAHFGTKQHGLLSEFIPDSKAWSQWSARYQARIDQQNDEQLRVQLIQNNTPKLLLRNYIAQEIIAAAEQHNYVPLATWLDGLSSPYHPPAIFETPEFKAYQRPPTKQHKGLILSCSS